MKRNNWSVQSLSQEEPDKKTLNVCVGGKDLYRKSFIEESKRHKPLGVLSYDFIVTAGAECPKGKFYELEYRLASSGVIHRALIQVVDPVADLPVVVSALFSANVITDDFVPGKARVTKLDQVKIGHCSMDDDSGEPVFTSCIFEPSDTISGSIKDYVSRPGFINEACLEYHQGVVREVWATGAHTSSDPIFVCGSSNVNDDRFKQQREEDMTELNCLLADALNIMNDYNLPHFLVMRDPNGTKDSVVLSYNVSHNTMLRIIDTLFQPDHNDHPAHNDHTAHNE